MTLKRLSYRSDQGTLTQLYRRQICRFTNCVGLDNLAKV